MSLRVVAAVVVVICAVGVLSFNADLLSGFTEHHSLGPLGMQMAVSAFCLTGAYRLDESLIGDDHFDPTIAGQERDFKETGEMREDEYEKASIYSLLYGSYRNAGIVEDPSGTPYRFTFNTWGLSNVGDKPFGPEYPQRHGMGAYHSLASMDSVKAYVAAKPNAHFLEIGCGTGAGADLISRMVYPTIKYTALDMQAAAIETCVRVHAAHDNPHLKCIQGNGKVLPIPDNSVDVVVVSETHIAEMEIGPEEIAIFAEMKRVLIPGGLFIWGNALPTKVWGDGSNYLQANGFQVCGSNNHTSRAIEARDQDIDRVNSFVDQMLGGYPVFKTPVVGAPCRHAMDRMVKNFYRHPGTDLYQRMVVGADSYMNLCHKME